MASRRERGAAMLELALVLPLLLLLLTGVADLGRAFFVAAALQEAAQEGAFYAAQHPDQPAEARQRAVDASSTPQISMSDVAVTCPAPNQVAVTVSHTFDLITPFLSQAVGDGIEMRRTQVAHVLRSSPCVPSP